VSDMAGEAARVAVERCGNSGDTKLKLGNSEMRNAEERESRIRLSDEFSAQIASARG
jgi:hypothetical protein